MLGKVIFMVSRELLDLLCKGIAVELQMSIQCMWQQIMVKGIEGAAVETILRQAAAEKLKNAEDLGKRLVYLAGVPPVTFDPVHVGHGLDDMLKEDIQIEEEIINLLRQSIQLANREGDFTTRRLLENILSYEEEHLDKFSKLLVGMTKPFTQLKLDSG